MKHRTLNSISTMPKSAKSNKKTATQEPQGDGDSGYSSELEPFSQEYLDQLLQKAKTGASNGESAVGSRGKEEDIILLSKEDEEL